MLEHPELELIERLPLHRYFGVQKLVLGKKEAFFEIEVSDRTINIFSRLHGGVFYGLCDLVAYMAILSELEPRETAVTQDIHVSVLRPAKIGDLVSFRGKLVQKGKRIVFSNGEAFIDGKLAAVAHVTKSIVPYDH